MLARSALAHWVFLIVIISVVAGCTAAPSPTPIMITREITVPVTVIVTRKVTVPVTIVVTKEVTRIVTREVSREITRVVTRVVTATPTAAPTATPTPKAPRVGTRGNPYAQGQWVEIKQYGRTIRLRLVRTARGKEAYEIVNRGNEFFVSTPGEGKEFFLAYFEVEYTAGRDADDAWGVDFTDFAISANNHLLGGAIVSFGDDRAELGAVMYPGAIAQGWVPFIIPIGASVEGIAYGDLEPEIWFASP